MIHLVSCDQIVEVCQRIHQELDRLVLHHDLLLDSNICHSWRAQFHQNTLTYERHVKYFIQIDQRSIFDELFDSDMQEEVLALLVFECKGNNPESKYSKDEIRFMHRIFNYVSS